MQREIIDDEYVLFRDLLMRNKIEKAASIFQREELDFLDFEEIILLDTDEVWELGLFKIENSDLQFTQPELKKLKEIFILFFSKICLYVKNREKK